jgi:hypothetical protein
MKTPTLLMALLAPLLLASAVRADATPRDPAAAEVLFDRGRTAAAREDWSRACPAFEQSQALDPATGTLLNLAECHYRLGKVATAWQEFVEGLRELPPADPRRDYAAGRVSELEKRLPRVVIQLGSVAPRETRVTKDGVPMPPGTLGVPLPVDPAEVEIVVTAPGRKAQRFTVEAKEGQTSAVDVNVGPEIVAAATARVGSPIRTVGWVSGGVGVGAIGLGAVAGILALSHASAYRSDCGPGGACNPGQLVTANSDASSAKSFAAVSTVGLIAGAALVGVGAYLVLSHPARAQGASSSVGITVLPGSAVGVCRVSF